jgi:hypothetical protein
VVLDRINTVLREGRLARAARPEPKVQEKAIL